MKLHEIKNISGTNISDKQIHDKQELIKKLGIKGDTLLTKAFYDLSDNELKTVIKLIGNHDFADTSEIDSKELEKGIKVEKEHTKNLLIARLVALDHLFELKNYYTKLEKMEREK